MFWIVTILLQKQFGYTYTYTSIPRSHFLLQTSTCSYMALLNKPQLYTDMQKVPTKQLHAKTTNKILKSKNYTLNQVFGPFLKRTRLFTRYLNSTQFTHTIVACQKYLRKLGLLEFHEPSKLSRPYPSTKLLH